MVVTTPHVTKSPRSRWLIAQVWAMALIAYVVIIAAATAPTAVVVNDIVWALAALSACLVCARTALRLANADRRAWSLIGIGCGSWFIGQLHWNYVQLIGGVTMPYPNWGQFFYSAFAAFLIAGVLNLAEARSGGAALTRRRVGNVALVLCCLVAAVILAFFELLASSQRSTAFLMVGALHSVLLGCTFLVALFALWTYRWNRSWTPMLLIVVGTGVYAITNLIYSYVLVAGTYVVSDLINGSWIVVFGFIAWAAHERWWLEEHPTVEVPQRMQVRERWLEAIVPALLIIIMIGVGLAVPTRPTPRVLVLTGVTFILFALILALREAWIQSDAQRLHDQLHEANVQLATANTELRASETRYRELNGQLEQRVARRTEELGRAYGELESFAYAVAHDLKAPLRSINSFAQLLRTHLGDHSSAEIDSYLNRIRSGSLRMAALIDDLLAYSHVEQRSMNEVQIDLNAMLATILAHRADDIQRRNVAVNIDLQMHTLVADAEGMNLVLRNLIENALKYTRAVEHPAIQIRSMRRGTHVVVEIVDNGIGFDMEHHDQIFKIFQRLHREEEYPGTGIGLALVRKAVQRMRGRVWAEARLGTGATFYVELPLALDTIAAA